MQESQNTFGEGLVMDLNPLTTPNNVLTNALNATLVTYNGNEFVLQNDMGNGRVETAKLPSGFVPLGVKEHGGIIYVASYNPITNEGQLGSFPSPERNLSQNEISDKKTDVKKEQFTDGEGQVDKYYMRYDLMPEGMTLNPGDKFGIYIGGENTAIISYKEEDRPRLVTFHPAILDSLGNISYIDDEVMTEGKIAKGIEFGEAPAVGDDVDSQAVFDKLLVYKGKKSGRLLLIVELETLEDFVVTRGIVSYKDPEKDKIESTGSSVAHYSDSKSEGEENVEFAVKFYCSGWPKVDNNYIHFKGVKFAGISGETEEEKEFSITDDKLQSLSFAYGGFKKGSEDNILKYRITPYTELGPNAALARTGIINFNLLGTGNIILNEWRYYVEGNKLRLNYGFDVNLLEGESVKEVTMEFYDVFYGINYADKGHKFNCKSTINGNFNGNYTEYFELPYALKHADKYDKEYENIDYIYKEVVGDPFKLKGNQLLKDDFYLVRITLVTGGLVNKQNKGQVTVKRFYRFMYTNGIFNRQYVEGIERNFSVIPVKPEKIRLSAGFTGNGGTEDNAEFKVEYYNSPTPNGTVSGMQAAMPDDEEAIEEFKKEPIKANLYQDWGTSANNKMVVKAEITNLDATKELEGESYHEFGEYAAGFFSLELNGNSACEVSYDNSGFQMQNFGGTPGEKETSYVDLTKEDNKVKKFSDVKETLSITDVIGKEVYEGGSDEGRKTFETLKDVQFYDVEGNVTAANAEGKDPEISFPAVKGRLIRRAASDMDFGQRSMTCEEARPCFYKKMSMEEQEAMVLGNARTGEGDLDESGNVLIYTGDTDGAANEFWYYGTAKEGEAKGGSGDKLIISWADHKEQHDIIPHATLVKAFADCMGSSLQHSAVWAMTNRIDESLHSHMDRYKAATPGLYRAENTTNNSNLIVKSTGYERVQHYKWNVAVALWRTTNSTEAKPDYAAINLGGSNYKTFIGYVQKVLSTMFIVQPKIQRILMVRDSARYAFSNKYPTKVFIGFQVGTIGDDGSFNLTAIKTKHAPVKLYKKNGKERYFDVKTVSEEIKSLSEWKPEEDKWFESIEDLSGTADVYQCSYLNIPYPYEEGSDGQPKKYDKNDDKERASKNNSLTYDASMFHIDEKTKKVYIGAELSLGAMMDVTNVTAAWEDESDNTLQYVYLEENGKMRMAEFVDYLGTELNKSNVYYLTKDNKLIAGDSDQLANVELQNIQYKKNLQNLFKPVEQNGFKIPVLNTGAIKTNVSMAFVANEKDHIDEWKDDYMFAVDNQWPFYTEAYFGITQATMGGSGDFITNNKNQLNGN